VGRVFLEVLNNVGNRGAVQIVGALSLSLPIPLCLLPVSGMHKFPSLPLLPWQDGDAGYIHAHGHGLRAQGGNGGGRGGRQAAALTERQDDEAKGVHACGQR